MKRHEPNITSFVFGLIFIGLALVWPFVELDILDYSGLGIILPAVLIGAGIVGLAMSVRKSRRPEVAEADPVAIAKLEHELGMDTPPDKPTN